MNITNFKPYNTNTEYNQIYYGDFDTIRTENSRRNSKNYNPNKTITSTSCSNSKFKNIQI